MVGRLRMMVSAARAFMTPFRLLEMMEAKASIMPAKDFGGDAGHLDGLLVFGEHIFEQVGILVVLVEEFHALDAFHHHLVGTQGGGEVGEGFLVFDKFKHFAVASGFLQLVFEGFGGLLMSRRCAR